MSGTIAGGRKAAITNKERHGENFYTELGKRGGAASRAGGFGYFGHDWAVENGRKGGKAPRRTKATESEVNH